MQLFDVVMAANTALPENYRPLYLGTEQVGLLSPLQCELLDNAGFRLQSYLKGYAWADFSDFTTNNQRLAEITATLRAQGHVPGWRDELYALASDFQHAPQAIVERAAVPIFGGYGYGVHVNGLVRKKDGIYMWLGKRALTKPTDPGKLDQLAAGGQPWNILPFKNMQKECAEEAGLSRDITAQAMRAGMGSYFFAVNNGIRADVMFFYDLWLAETFVPHNTDGEVASFECLPLAEIPVLLKAGDKVKFNSALVMIDCCIRHGIITEQEPKYQQICEYLHPRLAWFAKMDK